MKVFRRISGNIDSNEKKRIIESAFGCKMDWSYFSKDLDDKSDEYSKIKRLVHSLDLQDAVAGTEFTKEEIAGAKALAFNGSWASGYPEPQDPVQFLKNTYANSCPECGVHDEQKAPFQIREPRLARHKLLSLNWVHDELFAERQFYEEFFKTKDLHKLDAMLYKKNIPVKSVVQLLILVADFTLDMKNRELSTCSVCTRIKYTPADSGFFPAPANNNFQIIKTQESFGSGHSASRRILVSNEMMVKMIEQKVAKYHHFTPCK